MEKYNVFDEYLKKSKFIREYCEKNEKVLFEMIRLDTSTEKIIISLNAVGSEIDEVISTIEELKKQKTLPQSLFELS